MPPSPSDLEELVAELAPIAGARLQRLDVVDEQELVLEFRAPGRTLRLVGCARSGAQSLHLLPERPVRSIPHGPQQAFLRTRLVGQKLARLAVEQRTLELVFERDTLTLDLRGGRNALRVSPGGEPAPEATPAEDLPAFPLATAAGAAFVRGAPADEDERIRRLLARDLRATRKRLRRLEVNLGRDLERLNAYEADRQRGELLKTMMGQVRRGDASFTAVDWSTGAEVEVALDPRLTPQANLQRFFDRAKKADRGRPRVEARLDEVAGRVRALDQRLAAVAEAEGEALRALATEAGAGLEGFRLAPERKRAGRGERSPIEKVARRFEAEDGSVIWVGRGPRENDKLTFSFSKGDDLWLHARGSPGAHVLIVATSGKTPSAEAVLDAAHLALHASPQKGESKAEVMITEARHVKKTKGAPAGLVGVGSSRTILVRLEPERLARLYGRDQV